MALEYNTPFCERFGAEDAFDPECIECYRINRDRSNACFRETFVIGQMAEQKVTRKEAEDRFDYIIDRLTGVGDC